MAGMNEKASRRQGAVSKLLAGAAAASESGIVDPNPVTAPIAGDPPVPAAEVVPAPPADAAPDDALVHLDPTLKAEPGALPPISTAAPVLATEPSAIDVVQADARADRIAAGQEPGATGDPALDAVAGQPTIAIERGVLDRFAQNVAASTTGAVSWTPGQSDPLPSIDEISAVLDRLSTVDPAGWHVIRERHFGMFYHQGRVPAPSEADAIAVVTVSGPPQGRRRAGVTFGVDPKVFLASDLTAGAIAALRADPLLAVSVTTLDGDAALAAFDAWPG